MNSAGIVYKLSELGSLSLSDILSVVSPLVLSFNFDKLTSGVHSFESIQFQLFTPKYEFKQHNG